MALSPTLSPTRRPRVYINGVDKTSSKTVATPIQITYTLGSRGVAKVSTLDFRLDTASAYRSTIDQPITIKNEPETVTLFDGTILNVKDRPFGEPNYGTETSIDATDYTRACDARIVNKTYAAGQTRKDIVSDLRTTYLAAFGITLDAGMTDGPVMPEMTFGNVTVTAALARVALVAGQVSGVPEIWRITPARVLQAFAVGASTAPYSLTSSNGKILGGPSWTKSRGQYVNQVYLTYGTERLIEKTQTFAASSVGQTSWTLDYIGAGSVLHSVITVDGNLTVLGPFGEAYTWTWNPTTNSIIRTPGSPGGEVVSVTYDAQFPASVRRPETPPAQPWDAVISAPDVFDKAAAINLADALLARYTAAVARTVTIRTREGLVLPGDTITITVPERTLSGSWLITAVTIRTEADAQFTYDLTCVEGTVPQDSWQDSLRNLFGTGSTAGTVISGSVPTPMGGVSGSGTAGNLSKWATTTTLGNSIVSESGTVVSIAGSLSLSGESIISGTGSPEGVVTAPPGSLFLQDDGTVWRKATGTGNTGWAGFGGLSGSGTTNTLAKWTSGTGLGNSIVSESGTVLTVAGTVSATGFGTHSLTSSGSGEHILNLRNTSSNAAAYASVLVGNDARFYTCAISAYSTTRTPAATFDYADGVAVSSYGAGGLALAAADAAGTLRQYWGGSTLRLEGTGAYLQPGANYFLNLGRISQKYLTLHAAELWVETLVAQNTLATIGGRVLVAPTNILSADLAPASTTIIVKYNNLANGDIIYLEAEGKVEFMSVDSAPGGSPGLYTYTVTRNLDATAPNDWWAGDAILNTGQAGNGFIDIYSLRGIRAGTEIGPTIVGNIRNSTTYNDWSPRWAIGNLDGLYGYSGSTYGCAFGAPTAAHILIDTTNGIRIRHNTTDRIVLSAAGNASFTGSITAGSGLIAGWTIDAAVIYKSIVGVGEAWLYSSYPVDTGGGVVNHASVILTDGIANWVAMFSGGASTHIALMVGGGTPTAAPFRVTYGGALTATSATITGNITATSGNVIGAIAAGAITSTHIAANTITAGNIAAGTITSTELAANSVTADEIDVSTLSAISANLGSVTAGSITGVTISAGNWTINSSGLTASVSGTAASMVNWSNGQAINGASIFGGNGISIIGFGLAADRLWATGMNSTTSALYPFVADANGQLYQKTNGYNGTLNLTGGGFINVDRGIVTGGG